MSSVRSAKSENVLVAMSLIHKLKKLDVKKDPWGTAAWIGYLHGKECLLCTAKLQTQRKLCMICINQSSARSSVSSYTIPFGQTVSKAFCRSKRTALVATLLLRLLVMY